MLLLSEEKLCWCQFRTIFLRSLDLTRRKLRFSLLALPCTSSYFVRFTHNATIYRLGHQVYTHSWSVQNGSFWIPVNRINETSFYVQLWYLILGRSRMIPAATLLSFWLTAVKTKTLVHWHTALVFGSLTRFRVKITSNSRRFWTNWGILHRLFLSHSHLFS